MNIDNLVDFFVNHNDEQMCLALLQTIAHPEQGGLGYTIKFFNPPVDIDGWEFDHATKTIYLDTESFFSSYSEAELAETLRKAIETEILETRASLLSRVGWGSGKVLLGVVEVGTGFVGIIIPEPATTIAGVAVLALGVNTVTDGFTQLAGGNKGNGYNLLGMGAGAVGAKLAGIAGKDPKDGEMLGKGAFLLASLAFGGIGSIRILKIPNQTFLRLGVGGRPGGLQLGRLDLLYGSERAKDGLTIINISNNSNQYILRFVTHSGQLVVNGRIVGVQRVLNHATSAKEIVKGLLKLLIHGAKA